MKKSYTAKISPQGQITLPVSLRKQLNLETSQYVMLYIDSENKIKVSGELPIEKHFGTLKNAWTKPGQDAAEYARKLRDSMQPKL